MTRRGRPFRTVLTVLAAWSALVGAALVGAAPAGGAPGAVEAGGRRFKAAVPNGRRFGPALPPGTSTEDVLGVGVDRRARMDRLALVGSVGTDDGPLPLRGLNQYALPEGSIGAFTTDRGSASRVRATCGTDTDRGAPCSTATYEVTVRRSRGGGVRHRGRRSHRPGHRGSGRP